METGPDVTVMDLPDAIVRLSFKLEIPATVRVPPIATGPDVTVIDFPEAIVTLSLSCDVPVTVRLPPVVTDPVSVLEPVITALPDNVVEESIIKFPFNCKLPVYELSAIKVSSDAFSHANPYPVVLVIRLRIAHDVTSP
jgi:hypothetical protein